MMAAVEPDAAGDRKPAHPVADIRPRRLGQQVMVVGHNPEVTMLAGYLTGSEIDSLPTCGIFCVDFDVTSWEEVTGGRGVFVFLHYPTHYS